MISESNIIDRYTYLISQKDVLSNIDRNISPKYSPTWDNLGAGSFSCTFLIQFEFRVWREHAFKEFRKWGNFLLCRVVYIILDCHLFTRLQNFLFPTIRRSKYHKIIRYSIWNGLISLRFTCAKTPKTVYRLSKIFSIYLRFPILIQ